MITRSSLDTEYLVYPVTFTVGGVVINPTGDPVAFAFKPNPANANPVTADWISGTWVTTGSGTYQAQVLVGPSNGGTNLAVGLYNVWIRITDSPEIPIRIIDLLSIV